MTGMNLQLSSKRQADFPDFFQGPNIRSKAYHVRQLI
jgi:hypothetical protein